MRGVASSSIARELHNVGLDGHPLAHRRSPNDRPQSLIFGLQPPPPGPGERGFVEATETAK